MHAQGSRGLNPSCNKLGLWKGYCGPQSRKLSCRMKTLSLPQTESLVEQVKQIFNSALENVNLKDGLSRPGDKLTFRRVLGTCSVQRSLLLLLLLLRLRRRRLSPLQLNWFAPSPGPPASVAAVTTSPRTRCHHSFVHRDDNTTS